MAYDDRPYDIVRPGDVGRLLETCRGSGQRPTKSPEWNLERWKSVRDLIVGWYGDDRPDAEAVPDLVDRLCGWMDPVQRQVIERLFAHWRAMYPKTSSDGIDLDPDPISFIDHDRRVELKVKPTFAFVQSSGGREVIRLRTGAIGTGRFEAAVLYTEPGPGDYFIDAMLDAGSAEEIVDPPDRRELVERVIGAGAGDQQLTLVPGVHCFSCSSSPRCGQYPPARGGRVFNSTRSITLSKTNLDWIDTCQRRVAWDRVYQIPRHREDEFEASGRLLAGISFHEMAAAAILSDSPESVVTAALGQAPPDAVADLSLLWENHQALWADEQLEARRTEFWVGLTLLSPGIRVDSRGKEVFEPVAVTLVGSIDVTGREADGTPMVVEHRTGTSGAHGTYEAELYAAGAALAIARAGGARPPAVAVHLHHLRPDPPVCERQVFDGDRLEAAIDQLGLVASTAVSWHPLDSLSPSFEVGPWCGSCQHRRRCEGFR